MKGRAMILYVVYMLVVAISVLTCLFVTGNALALLGILFLFFMSNVVPPMERMVAPPPERDSAIGFTADLEGATDL
jgi:hypothetical protein